MKHINLYIANDGKEFYDETDCAMYEFDLRADEAQFKDRIDFYDASGNPIDILDPEQYDDVCCIIPHDEHIMEEYNEAYHDCNLDVLVDDMPYCMYHSDDYRMGILVYDAESNEWENLNEKVAQLQAELEFWKSRG